MTADELARDYLRRARVRRRVLDLLFSAGEHADVVREAQELDELALKGMLRHAGIDPPKWHQPRPAGRCGLVGSRHFR